MNHILSILFNAACIPVAWLAVNGHVQCGNAIKFLSGLTIAGSVLLLAVIAIAGYASHGRPTWYQRCAIAIDVAITAILAAGGWFWCAAAMAVGILVTLVVFACEEKGGAK